MSLAALGFADRDTDGCNWGGLLPFVAAPRSFVRYALSMALIRIALISLAAAIAGCAAGSIVIFGELGRASFVALPFTCMGSLLLLAPTYAAARESGVAVGPCYARLLIAGSLAGGLMLGFVSVATDPFRSAAMGSAYGALTAAFWVALHAFLKRLADFKT